MKKSVLFSLAIVTALLVSNDARAADVAFISAGDDAFQDDGVKYGGKGGKGGGGAIADVELNFMKCYQTDGVGILGAPNRFQYEATPRVTVGYVGSGGLGVLA